MRRTALGIVRYESFRCTRDPLTPGPSPTTASLADARGAAGERGENIAFYCAKPYTDSAGVSRSQISE